MPKAISTQIRRDNQNLVKQKKGGCSVINPFLEAL